MAVIEDRRAETRRQRRRLSGGHAPEHSRRRTSSLPPDLQKPKRRGSLFGNNETNITTVTNDYGYEDATNEANDYGYGEARPDEANEANDYGYEEARPPPRRRRSLFGNMSGDSHARKPRRGSFFGSSGGQQRRDSLSNRLSRNKKSNQEGELANEVLAAFDDFED